MADPYSTDEVQSYHDPWYTFQDSFLEFNAWSARRASEKQKDLLILEAFKGSDVGSAWFPSQRDVMHARLERQDLLLVPIHFAFSSGKIKDWCGWPKEMLANNGFVETLRVAGVLKPVALSQAVEWLCRLKALKEYPMAKCGYTSGTALLACSRIGKRKIKGQIVSDVDGFLDDYGSFNFHAYKVMLGTFAPLEVSLFDKALLAVLGNQIVNFIAGDLGHLEALAVVTPSMLLCFTWWRTWSLECYCPERVTRLFDYDQDVPRAPSSDKTDWNKAMWPYIDEAASNMWSEGAATLRFFSIAKMSTMSPLMLEYWGTLLKSNYHKHSQGFLMRGYDGQWVPVCLLVLGLVEEEYGAAEGELEQEATDNAGIGGEADEAAPSRKSSLDKRKSVAQPLKSATSDEGFGLVPILGNDEIPSKPKEAEKVEALAVNMEEALANPDIHRKILAKEIGEPPLPDKILNFVDSTVDWSDPASFTAELAKKAKASEVLL
ncbi:hypothetical protein SLEP1_g24262 [Rubroshorea leprosula]|uniref:Uncharacterized protein n=1 Tax=Rubroshorea leprosula TaxID=152421 RepID=A0AAV5JNS9_9ROSI|nr:hypothetical protein SLEP1_g24262 [Rubroshorea leprosula]